MEDASGSDPRFSDYVPLFRIRLLLGNRPDMSTTDRLLAMHAVYRWTEVRRGLLEGAKPTGSDMEIAVTVQAGGDRDAEVIAEELAAATECRVIAVERLLGVALRPWHLLATAARRREGWSGPWQQASFWESVSPKRQGPTLVMHRWETMVWGPESTGIVVECYGADRRIRLKIHDDRGQVWWAEVSADRAGVWTWIIKPIGPGSAHYLGRNVVRYPSWQSALDALVAYIRRYQHLAAIDEISGDSPVFP